MILSGEYLYSIAALFSGLAYLSKNILWLRILLVIAALVYIVSGISLNITSMIGWNSVYLAINLYHITLLLLDKTTINLPVETRDLYHQVFSSLSTREFKKLILTNPFGAIKDKVIICETEKTNQLFLILKGQVNIVKSEKIIASLGVGDLIGDMSFISKETAAASAIALGTVEYAYWTHDNLEKLKIKNIDTYNKFLSIIGRDLVRKLKHKNEMNDSTIIRQSSII